MAHKDWKGPGVYECWDGAGRWNKRVYKPCDDLVYQWTYQKLEDFEPPKPPKPELPDGVYAILVASNESVISRLKRDSLWIAPFNPEIQCDEYTILGRIPVEPVE
jgi:hypothetical protein